MYLSVICILSVLSLPWPFLSGEHRIQRGYGDYNSGNLRAQYEAFHPAVDIFPPFPASIVQVPYDTDNFVSGRFFDPDLNSWSLLITEENPYTPGENGYLYSHIHGAQTSFSPGDNLNQLAECSNPPPNGYRHVHISVYDPALWGTGPGGDCPEPGIANIIDELDVLDQIVRFAGVYNNHGIVFLPEGGGFTSSFEPVIRGPVEMIVAPRSSFAETGILDSCGVRSIQVLSVNRESPFDGIYNPSTYYSNRTVFNWDEQLVDCVTQPAPPEYFYLFEGGLVPPLQFKSTPFTHYYHIANTSTNDPGINGIGNIWTEPYSAQADYDYSQTHPEVRCRGAWDTILKINWDSVDQSACENSEACFPDGRYLIDVSATSHTGNTASISLPVDDVTSPNHIPVGIIVDNFIPHVQQIVFYTTYPDGEYHKLYFGKWVSVNNTLRSLCRIVNGYLPGGVGKVPCGYLGMAVRFSEPMQTNQHPSISVEGRIGDIVLWTTAGDPRHELAPSEMDPAILQMS